MAVMHFLEALFPPRVTERIVRTLRPEILGALVSPHVLTNTGHETIALLPYRHPSVNALIIEAKYHHNERAFTLLGHVLAEYVQAFVSDRDEFSKNNFMLVPIPLSHTRLTERTYNQTERICREALHHLGIPGTPATHVLMRTKDTVSQTRLVKEHRLKNMQGVFEARSLSQNVHYLLIDDVVTTGATLADGVRALKSAGASRITAIALAH